MRGLGPALRAEGASCILALMNSILGRIHSYESFGTVDGPGLRFVIFFQGCPLRCLYCHNPDTWNPDAGTQVRAEDVIEKIEKCRAYLRKGGGDR